MFITPAYTNPTPIVDGPTNFIEGADVNTLFSDANQVNDTLNAIDDQRALSIATSNITLVANRDTFAPVDAAGGNRTVTLPLASAHTTQPITIKKVDGGFPNSNGSAGRVIIARSGSDRIENPDDPRSTPIATTYTLYEPDEEVTLYPVENAWRVIHAYHPNRIRFVVYHSSNQTVTSSASPVSFNTQSIDYGGYFASNRFTPRVPGVYAFSASQTIISGPTSSITISFYVNGSEVFKIYRDSSTSNTVGSGSSLTWDMNGTGDYIEVWAASSTNRTLALGQQNCSFQGQLVRRN